MQRVWQVLCLVRARGPQVWIQEKEADSDSRAKLVARVAPGCAHHERPLRPCNLLCSMRNGSFCLFVFGSASKRRLDTDYRAHCCCHALLPCTAAAGLCTNGTPHGPVQDPVFGEGAEAWFSTRVQPGSRTVVQYFDSVLWCRTLVQKGKGKAAILDAWVLNLALLPGSCEGLHINSATQGHASCCAG